MCVLYIYIYISSFIVNPMTHRSREQTKNQTIRRRKHNIIALTITKSRKSPPLPYDCPITPLPLLSSLMLLSAILVLHFDPHLSFSNHIYNLSRSCLMHMRDLRRIRPMLDFKTASNIATSIVHSKLDYCNSLFLNLDSTQIQRLQLIQNSLARAVTRTPRHHHITPVLKSLHWLKVPERIHFKVLSLTYNSLQSS